MSMNIDSLARSGGATGALSALGQDLAARARRLWEAYWDDRARRATVRMLEALDDRVLNDIGLTRSEIRAAVFGHDPARARQYDPRWRKPSIV